AAAAAAAAERLGEQLWREELAYGHTADAGSEPGAAALARRYETEGFAARVAALVGSNAAAPPLERLERGELVVDVAGRNRLAAANRAAADGVRAAMQRENLRRDLVACRVRQDCWDSMEMHAAKVVAVQSGSEMEVRNFALRRRDANELAMVAKVKRLRAVELRELRRGRYGSTSRAWPGSVEEVPRDASWIFNEGALLPVVDVVTALREATAAQNASKTRGGGGDGLMGGGSGNSG
ncbi:unnamed protein product, partial [Phaeothamnion confervicola]